MWQVHARTNHIRPFPTIPSRQAILGVASILASSQLINVDFADLRAVVEGHGISRREMATKHESPARNTHEPAVRVGGSAAAQ